MLPLIMSNNKPSKEKKLSLIFLWISDDNLIWCVNIFHKVRKRKRSNCTKFVFAGKTTISEAGLGGKNRSCI